MAPRAVFWGRPAAPSGVNYQFTAPGMWDNACQTRVTTVPRRAPGPCRKSGPVSAVLMGRGGRSRLVS